MRKLLVALALLVSSSATAHAAGLLPTSQLAIVPPTLAMAGALHGGDDDDDGRPMPAGLSLLAVSLWAAAGLGAMVMLRRRETVCRIEA